MLVAEQSAENAKTVNQGNPRFQTYTSGSISDQAAKQTVFSVFKSVLSMQSMECHGVSEQLMAAAATEEDVKKISQVMAQTVRKLETGNADPEPCPRRTAFRAKWRARTKSFQGVSVPGFTKMDTEDQEAIKRSLSNGITEKRRLAKKCKQEGKVCNLLRLWVWTQLVAVPCYLALSRIGESDHPGPACATAKLFGDQFGATGQWATNLTSKCEVKLTPLLAQDGECRQIFSERFGKESYPYTSSVSQDIQGTHSHMDRLSLLVSPEHEGDFVHIQRFSDYPFLVRVGGECDESRHVSAQMQICDGSGKERKTPFCHHAKRGGRKHTGKKRKLGIAEGGE